MTLKKYLDPPALRKNVMRLEKTVKGSTEISGEKFGKYPYRISLNNVELIQQNKKKELIAIFGAHILSSIAKYVQQCPAKKAIYRNCNNKGHCTKACRSKEIK